MKLVNKKTHVVFVISSWKFFRSHRIVLLEYLRAENVRVTVVCGEAFREDILRELAQFGVEYKTALMSARGKSGREIFQDALRLSKVLSSLDGQCLVHAISMRPIVLSCLALLIKFNLRHKVALCCSITGFGIFRTRQSLLIRNFLFVMRLIIGLISTFYKITGVYQTAHDRSFGQGFLGLDGPVIGGVGISDIFFRPLSVNELNRPVKIAFCSRLLISKGVFEYLKIINLVKAFRQDLSIDWILIGSRDDTHSEAVDAVTCGKLCEALGVDFMVDLKESDVARELFDTDILLHPSVYGEGIPKVVLEAAAASVLPIVTNQPGIMEIFSSGINCIEIDIADSLRSVQVICDLVEDQDRLRQLQDEAHKLAVAKFSRESFYEAQVKAYENIL